MDKPEPSPSDVMARQRTDLAFERTLMAADRSLMAWVRTALSMIGFGFAIYKFLQGMHAEGVQLTPRPEGARNIGLFLLGLGTLSVALGSAEYVGTVRQLRKGYPVSMLRGTLVIALVIGLLGALLFVSIIFKADLI